MKDALRGGYAQELLEKRKGGHRPLHHQGLLFAQDAAGGHAQIRAVLVLADSVPDAAQGGPGILVDGGPHVGGDRLSLAGFLLHDDHHAFALGLRLHAHRLGLDQPIIAKGVASLQIMGWVLHVYLCLLIRKLEQFPPTIYCRWADMGAVRNVKGGLSVSSFSFFPTSLSLVFRTLHLSIPHSPTMCSRHTAVIVRDLRLLDMLSSLLEHPVFLTNSYLFFKIHL